MANEKAEGGLGKAGVALSLPVLVLIAVIFGGNRNAEDSQNESRLQKAFESTQDIPASPGLYSRRAELGEDPLAFVADAQRELRHITVSENERRGAEAFLKDLNAVAESSQVSTAGGPSAQPQIDRFPGGMLLLPVMIAGGDSTAAVRQRVRTREAVVQALMSRGYRLQYPNRLSYMRLPIRADLGSDLPDLKYVTVPVKIYKYHSSMEDGGFADKQGYQSVLVFWIDQSQLGQQPLSAIAQVVISTYINTYGVPQSKADGGRQPIEERAQTDTATMADADVATMVNAILESYARLGQRKEVETGDEANARRIQEIFGLYPVEREAKRIDEQRIEEQRIAEAERKAKQEQVAEAETEEAETEAVSSNSAAPSQATVTQLDAYQATVDEAQQFIGKLVDLKNLIRDHVDLAIIGPHNSDGLFDIIREDKSWDTNHRGQSNLQFRSDYFREVFRSARIYSTRSTVDRDSMVLEHDPTISSEIRGGGRFTLHDCGIDLIHYIGTDAVLAETLKEELLVRRRWPTPDSGHMILVTERDTLYGTLVDRSFLQAGVPRESCHVIRYLKSERFDKKDVEFEPLAQIRGQLDQLEQNGLSVRDVMSVGVLGSSVGSKMELLRYIRKRFPAATLFTTDLDEGLFANNVPVEVRNTIVASHFGLSLSPELNIEAPAFETGYQTATFAATLSLLRSPQLHQALSVEEYDESIGDVEKLAGNIFADPWGRRVETSRKREPLRPVLYELGRYGPVQLTLRDQAPANAIDIQPKPPPRWSDNPATWYFLGLLVLLFFLSIWLLAQVESKTEHAVSTAIATTTRLLSYGRQVVTLPTAHALTREKNFLRGTEIAVVISVVALFVLFAAGVLDDQRRMGEPIDFVDGISVWPSVWLLGLIGAAAFSMLPQTARQLQEEAKYIGRHKVPPSALVDQQGKPTALAAVTLKLRKLLEDYEARLRRGDTPKIVAISLVLTLVGYLLVYILGVNPSAPARGLLAIETALLVQVIVALTLIAYVVQATYSVFAARQACTDMIKTNTLYVESIVDQRLRRQIGETEAGEEIWDTEMQKTVVRQANVAMQLTEMIANHTRVVSRPVENAALFVLLFGLARTSVFDAWENSAPALSLLLVMLAVCIGSLWLFRTNLSKRRRELVAAMRRLAVSVEVDEGEDKGDTVDKLRTLADSISSIQQGVFRPLGSDPILRAFIYASGALITAANQWIQSTLAS